MMLLFLLFTACGGPASDSAAAYESIFDDDNEDSLSRFEGSEFFTVQRTSDGEELCNIIWQTAGIPAERTCAGCLWSFTVTGTFDPGISNIGLCEQPSDFTLTYASDGEQIYVAEGENFRPFAEVDMWMEQTDGFELRAEQPISANAFLKDANQGLVIRARVW